MAAFDYLTEFLTKEPHDEDYAGNTALVEPLEGYAECEEIPHLELGQLEYSDKGHTPNDQGAAVDETGLAETMVAEAGARANAGVDNLRDNMDVEMCIQNYGATIAATQKDGKAGPRRAMADMPGTWAENGSDVDWGI